jgi:hypothetical protein
VVAVRWPSFSDRCKLGHPRASSSASSVSFTRRPSVEFHPARASSIAQGALPPGVRAGRVVLLNVL